MKLLNIIDAVTSGLLSMVIALMLCVGFAVYLAIEIPLFVLNFCATESYRAWRSSLPAKMMTLREDHGIKAAHQ